MKRGGGRKRKGRGATAAGEPSADPAAATAPAAATPPAPRARRGSATGARRTTDTAVRRADARRAGEVTNVKRAGEVTNARRAGEVTNVRRGAARPEGADDELDTIEADPSLAQKLERLRARLIDPARPLEIAVCEGSPASQQRAREVLASLGCRIAPEAKPDAIRARAADRPLDAVLIGLPEGAALVAGLIERAPRPIVIASIAGALDDAGPRARAAGADLLVLRPHHKDSIAPALYAAIQLANLAIEREVARLQEAAARERLAHYGQADATTGFRHFDFFKQVLLTELKRAKRYGYSLAAAVVAFDPWPGPPPPPAVVRQLRKLVAGAIAANVRDIDMPVDLAADRMLVFLPYTDADGAEHVGRRIAQAVREHVEVREGDEAHRATVSIGIAAQRDGQPVSFARLMRDANSALRAATLKGRGRVVVRT
jgi:PleD family two-component response regulator